MAGSVAARRTSSAAVIQSQEVARRGLASEWKRIRLVLDHSMILNHFEFRSGIKVMEWPGGVWHQIGLFWASKVRAPARL